MPFKERSLIARDFYARSRRTTPSSMPIGKGPLVGGPCVLPLMERIEIRVP